jgi:hypothetical protein
LSVDRRVEQVGEDRQATFAFAHLSLMPLGRPQTLKILVKLWCIWRVLITSPALPERCRRPVMH